MARGDNLVFFFVVFVPEKLHLKDRREDAAEGGKKEEELLQSTAPFQN